MTYRKWDVFKVHAISEAKKAAFKRICHSELVSESDNCNNFTKVRSRNKFGMTKTLKLHSLLQKLKTSAPVGEVPS